MTSQRTIHRALPAGCVIALLVHLMQMPTATAFQTQFPAAAGNVVLIRIDDQPPLNGIYFRRIGNRSLVVCPETPFRNISGRQAKRILIDFFPGQPDREARHQGRLISEVASRFRIIEVRSDTLAEPATIDSSLAIVRENEPLRVFGFAPAEPENSQVTPVFREFSARTPESPRQGSASLRINYEDDKPAPGALLCDRDGLPVGLTTSYRNRSGETQTCYLLSSLEAGCRVSCSAGFQTDQGVNRTPHLVFLGGIYDALQQADEAEVLMGTPSEIRPDFVVGAERYKNPATENMIVVPVEWNPGMRSNNFRAVIPPDCGLSHDRDVIVQCRVRMGDTVWYTPPGLIPAGRGDFDLITAELLSELTNRAKEDNPPIKWPKPKPEFVEIPNRNTGTPSNRVILHAEPGRCVHSIVWNAAGSRCFILDRYGELYSLKPGDPSERIRLPLHAWSADLAMSATSLLVLAQHTLMIIDPETLIVRASISLPGVRQLAASTESDVVWLAHKNQISWIDISRPDHPVQPDAPQTVDTQINTTITTIMITPDQKHLVLADAVRLHRFEITENRTLNWQQSSTELPAGTFCLRQQQGRRITWVPSQTRPVSVPGFPTGRVFVFDVNNLATPQHGANTQLGMDPHSGGLLIPVGSHVSGELKFFRSDGSPAEALLMKNRQDFHRCSFCPQGRFVAVVLRSYTELIEVPDTITADSLRVEPLSTSPQLEVTPVKGITRRSGNWSATSLKLAAPVDSAVWLDPRTAILLTTDGTLHRIQFPECTRDATLQLPSCTNLIHTQTGLVARGTNRQLLFVVDPKTLKKQSEIAISQPGQMTGCPASQLVWMIHKSDARQPLSSRGQQVIGPHGLKCIDVNTGEQVAEIDATALDALANTVSVPSRRTPWRFTVNPQEIRMSPDGRFLFLRDERDLLRFRTDGNELVFEDGAWRLAAGNSGPIAISPDSQFVSMTHGAIPSRPEHPAGGHFGSFVFPVNDFSKVVVEALMESACDCIAIAAAAEPIFIAAAESPLTVFEDSGKTVIRPDSPAHEESSSLVVSPNGDILTTGPTAIFMTRTMPLTN